MIAIRRTGEALPTGAGRRPDRAPSACLLLLGTLLTTMPGLSQEAEQSKERKDGRWAILIAGISGDQQLQREFIDEVRDLHALLTGAMQYPVSHIEVLVDDPRTSSPVHEPRVRG